MTRLVSPLSRLFSILFLGVLFLGACDLSYPTANWADESYDHAELSGGYDLAGPHIGAACAGCHASADFAVLYEPESNQDCYACHAADYQEQHGETGYPTTCRTCHNGSVWPRGEFDHGAASGGFDLSAPHQALMCTRCHKANNFVPRWNPSGPGDCSTCHM